MVDRLDQRQGVLGARQRDPGMVDDGVEVFQTERDAGLGAQFTELFQPAQRREPHVAGDAVAGACGLTIDQLARMNDESRNPEYLSGFDGLLRGTHHLAGARRVVEISVQVPGHR